ncbi:MAG: hypothetical protein AB7P76_03820 [Candidatus Melainabacteria bacterium]
MTALSFRSSLFTPSKVLCLLAVMGLCFSACSKGPSRDVRPDTGELAPPSQTAPMDLGGPLPDHARVNTPARNLYEPIPHEGRELPEDAEGAEDEAANPVTVLEENTPAEAHPKPLTPIAPPPGNPAPAMGGPADTPVQPPAENKPVAPPNPMGGNSPASKTIHIP